MNFFQHQDVARQKTTLLVALLILAVLSLIAVTVFALGIFLYFIQSNATSISAVNAQNTPLFEHLLIFLQSQTALYVAIAVVTVVGVAMLFKYAQLSGGGRKVAEALGGRLVSHDNADADEKKILNIVEEMAIASGNPVPPVYVMDEQSINAFAAGLSRRDAVIGVTRGCIHLLNRDELQGVVAHEFSHIHNGDMRLNLRLVATLHGVLIIGLIGYFIFYGNSGYRHGRHGYHSSSGNRSKNQMAQISLGMALIAIGYGGTFFGNIIKAAVSRQREFLADASAVQYTRNPNGIGNALKKIGGFSAGSMLANNAASQFSHMYFGQGIKTAFSGLMATHPPLHERIKRVLPQWNESYINPEAEASTPAQRAPQASPGHPAGASQFSGEQTAAVIASSVMDSIGEPSDKHLATAQKIIQGIPEALRDAAHEPYSARALIYCLLLDSQKSIRQTQIAQLKDGAHPATFKVMQQLYRHVYQLPRAEHIALIEMSIPALKQLSPPQYKVFKTNLIALIQADQRISLFEWCTFRIVTNNAEAKTPPEKYGLKELHKEISLIFSLIIHAGKTESPGGAFQKGVESLGFNKVPFTLNTDNFSFPEIDTAIQKLSSLKVLQKPRFLKAVAEIIIADGKITPEEAELFRALADSLDCPVPPIQPHF